MHVEMYLRYIRTVLLDLETRTRINNSRDPSMANSVFLLASLRLSVSALLICTSLQLQGQLPQLPIKRLIGGYISILKLLRAHELQEFGNRALLRCW